MRIIPAVDVMDHQVVQLVGGVPGSQQIVMPDPIKAYGTYNYDVRLYPEIVGKVKVTVGE